jgi:hypothetical protein
MDGALLHVWPQTIYSIDDSGSALALLSCDPSKLHRVQFPMVHAMVLTRTHM